MGFINGKGTQIIVESETVATDDSFLRVSENLLDDRTITRPTGTNIATAEMASNDYVKVQGHKALCSNRTLHTVTYYDADYNVVATDEGVTGYSGNTKPSYIPENAVYARAKWWATAGTTHAKYKKTVSEDNEVSLYVSDMEFPMTDRRSEAMQHKMIDALQIYGNVFKNTSPEENDEIIRMIRAMSIRTLNESRHAFRIGQFNTYVQRGSSNWEQVGNMLADFGIDICGFEECQYHESEGADINLPAHLISRRPWQFKYRNTNLPYGTTDSPYSNRAMVSRFEVVESKEIPWTVDAGNYDNQSFLFTKVKMPRFLDCTGGVQYLGFYVVHISVATSENMTKETEEVIEHINSDGCAFHIVVSDTNDWFFDDDGKMLHWKQYENAGLKPVHDALSKTTTEGSPAHDSLDNIFVSSNINVLGYNIINGWDYPVEQNGNTVSISDHDFVYADLEFVYDDLVTRMRPMTEVALIHTLTNVSSDTEDNYHVPLTEAVTVNLTADDGYTLNSVTVKIAGSDVTSSYYSNGVVSIPASAIKGDIYIIAEAT